MISICGEEEIIIREMFFGKLSEQEFQVIFKCVIDVKNGKGIYREVSECGPDLSSATTKISSITGLGLGVSGVLSGVLYGLIRHKIEIERQLNAGITKATWVYDKFLCRHPTHSLFNGKIYHIKKGIRTGFFRRINPGQLVGCGCMAKPMIIFK
ncbi:hypothetical protein [Enterobacter cloacae]|uniref:hypothetical protein n=1 Tax=Enterobacter cloacae TaxID=550 RepID=UPI0028754DC4|nr:hypothetical protein [Enterobacter cloacae]MDR9913351.1 hypothetical protein [Enterobacter cloacae subsp. cloacae]